MTQGILPFKYEEEKNESGMTALAGLPIYGCNTKKLHNYAAIGRSSIMLLLNIFLTMPHAF